MKDNRQDVIDVGRALAQLREQAGVPANAIASRMGIETAFVLAVERGELDVRWQIIVRMLRALDASLFDLAAALGNETSQT